MNAGHWIKRVQVMLAVTVGAKTTSKLQFLTATRVVKITN